MMGQLAGRAVGRHCLPALRGAGGDAAYGSFEAIALSSCCDLGPAVSVCSSVLICANRVCPKVGAACWQGTGGALPGPDARFSWLDSDCWAFNAAIALHLLLTAYRRLQAL